MKKRIINISELSGKQFKDETFKLFIESCDETKFFLRHCVNKEADEESTAAYIALRQSLLAGKAKCLDVLDPQQDKYNALSIMRATRKGLDKSYKGAGLRFPEIEYTC